MDATKRCATCTHWEKHETPDRLWANPDNVGVCLYSAHEDMDPIGADRKMSARDGELYWAYLETRADFGCVCWEELKTDN